MSFKLEDYEDVASRIKRFREKYDSGRIVVDVISHDFEKGFILCETSVYRYAEDTLPAAVDIAHGDRDSYPVNMRKFFAEDTATSSVGRAIGLLLGTDKRPTREDMERVESPRVNMPATTAASRDENVWNAEEIVADLLGGTVVEPEELCEHGKMTRKEGTSQNGKAYLGFVCPKKGGCKPVWYNLGSDGRFHRPAHEGDRA